MSILNKDLFGREPVLCPHCEYGKNKPDFIKRCSKCGTGLRISPVNGVTAPPKWKRITSFLIDMIPIGLLFWIVEIIRGDISDNWIGVIVFFSYLLLYFTITPFLWNQTLGQKFFSLRLIDSRTIKRPSLNMLFIRSLLFLTLFSGIGYLYFLIRGYYWEKPSRTRLIIVNQI